LGVPVETLLGHDVSRAQQPGNGSRPGSGEDRGLSPAAYASNSALHQKLDELLGSPLGEGITRIVLESHRLICEGPDRACG
jgi:hypothetical protein